MHGQGCQRNVGGCRLPFGHGFRGVVVFIAQCNHLHGVFALGQIVELVVSLIVGGGYICAAARNHGCSGHSLAAAGDMAVDISLVVFANHHIAHAEVIVGHIAAVVEAHVIFVGIVNHGQVGTVALCALGQDVKLCHAVLLLDGCSLAHGDGQGFEHLLAA